MKRVALALLTVAFVFSAGGAAPGSAGCCTSSLGQDFVPLWSPDGSTIAFTRFVGGLVFVQLVPPSGGASRVVATGHDPAWSPDGAEIVFATAEGIRVIKLATGQTRRITSNQFDFAPAFSPDGGSIAFRRGRGDVWLASSVGTELRRIAPAFRARHVTGTAQRLSWSPDGTRIAFTAAREAKPSDDEVVVAAVDGSGRRTLASHRAHDREPTWAPTSERLAFTSMREGNAEVYVVDSDGGNLLNISRSRTYDAEADWAPNGNQLAFTSVRSGKTEIYRVAASGGAIRRLGGGPHTANHPEWSPDGSTVAFMGYSLCPGVGIYVLSAADGRDRRLTNDCTILGTEGPDRLVGTTGRDVIFGRAGDDTILAGDGDDVVQGEDGADELVGGIEPDRLDGGPGPDALRGDGGRDVLRGGTGPDRLYGGRAKDLLLARDGERDVVSCGPQRDRVLADRLDRVSRDCERVSRR